MNLIDKSTYSKDNNFDFIRLVLAFLVLLHHCKVLPEYNSNFPIFNLAGIAVDAFFVISGLLIVWSFDNKTKLKDFFIKRIFRIYPIYLILILIQSVVLFFLSNNPHNFSLIMKFIKYLSANMFFLNFIQPSIPGVLENLRYKAINGSLWSLKIEALFYLSLPFIYMIYKKFGYKILLIGYLFSAGFFILVSHFNISFLLKSFPSDLRFFIVGISLYFYGYKMKRLCNKAVFGILLPISIMFILSQNFIDKNIFQIYDIFFYPVLIGLCVYFTAFNLYNIKLKHDISYGMYIFHFPIIQMLVHFNPVKCNLITFIILITALTTGLSILSSIFIEEKFIQYGRTLIGKINQNKEPVAARTEPLANATN